MNLCILLFLFLMVLLTSFSSHLSLFLKFPFIFSSYLLLVSFVPTYLCGVFDRNILPLSALGFSLGFSHNLLFSCLVFPSSFVLATSRIHNLFIQFHGLVLANNTVLDCMLETCGIRSGRLLLISSPDGIYLLPNKEIENNA